jgi:hypothetical protein
MSANRDKALSMLTAGADVDAVADRLRVHRQTVIRWRREEGRVMTFGGRYKPHVTCKDDVRAGLPTCPYCELLKPCTCTGPRSAVEFMGRTREAEGSSRGNRYA